MFWMQQHGSPQTGREWERENKKIASPTATRLTTEQNDKTICHG
tara:strand:+ start:235 stop:366 length:132 start_codon:yes stop_codon:yes gene_type:complete